MSTLGGRCMRDWDSSSVLVEVIWLFPRELSKVDGQLTSIRNKVKLFRPGGLDAGGRCPLDLTPEILGGQGARAKDGMDSASPPSIG